MGDNDLPYIYADAENFGMKSNDTYLYILFQITHCDLDGHSLIWPFNNYTYYIDIA